MNIHLVDELPQELVYTIINYLPESDLYNFINSTFIVKSRFSDSHEWMKLVYQNEPGVTLNTVISVKQNYLLFRYPHYYLYDIRENIVRGGLVNLDLEEYRVIDGKLVSVHRGEYAWIILNYGYLTKVRKVGDKILLLTNSNNEKFIYKGGLVKIIGINDPIIKISIYAGRCFILTNNQEVYYSTIIDLSGINTANMIKWEIKAIDIEFYMNIMFIVDPVGILYYFNIRDATPGQSVNIKTVDHDIRIDKIFVVPTLLMFIDSHNKVYKLVDPNYGINQMFNFLGVELTNYLKVGPVDNLYATDIITYSYYSIYIKGRRF